MFPVQTFRKTAKTKVYLETMLFFRAILSSYFARNILNFDIFDFKNHGILTGYEEDCFIIAFSLYVLSKHYLLSFM